MHELQFQLSVTRAGNGTAMRWTCLHHRDQEMEDIFPLHGSVTWIRYSPDLRERYRPFF